MGWPGPMTDRQFRAWQLWLAFDLNRPSKLETYLMRIAQRAHQGRAANPDAVTLEMQRVEWETELNPRRAEALDPASPEAVRAAQEADIARMGGKVERRTITRSQARERDGA